MKAIVSFSGGMDSATVLFSAMKEYDQKQVAAVGFCYGSKHNQYENQAAADICASVGVSFKLIDLSGVMIAFKSNLLKTGGEIPEGHYEDASMAQTVVPGRNIIFISILSGLAWSLEAKEVWLGIHSGDHAIYPDCRPEFFDDMNRAIQLGTDGRVSLRAPFLHSNKKGILEEGFKMGVPYDLTRTCYKDQPTSCGKCGACQERLEAFASLNRTDPIRYGT